MAKDGAILTVAHYMIVLYDLSNGAIISITLNEP